jgi:8-oxo-dGTP pyrophosphatase MutT (NUDIX family)
MNDYANHFDWWTDGGGIRVSARAIIFNQAKDHILIERNFGDQNEFSNFIGGGVEVGETLQSCIERELNEETDARIIGAKYLFIVENFIPYNSEVRHSLEHYFEIELDRENVIPKNKSTEFIWVSIDEMPAIDLRPAIVRDCIVDGTYRRISHMVLGDDST